MSNSSNAEPMTTGTERRLYLYIECVLAVYWLYIGCILAVCWRFLDCNELQVQKKDDSLDYHTVSLLPLVRCAARSRVYQDEQERQRLRLLLVYVSWTRPVLRFLLPSR